MAVYKPGRPAKYNPTTGAGTAPSATPGKYRIRNACGSILYIGGTNNLLRRMEEHICNGKLAPGYTIEHQVADSRFASHTRREPRAGEDCAAPAAAEQVKRG